LFIDLILYLVFHSSWSKGLNLARQIQIIKLTKASEKQYNLLAEVLAAALVPESVLTSPNPKIYTNISLFNAESARNVLEQLPNLLH